MKITVANRDEYNEYFNKRSMTLNLSELKDQEDYVIYNILFESGENDVSLMYSSINNLLAEQYERNSYIRLEELKEIDDLFHTLDKEQCKIINAYAEINNYKIKNLNEIRELIAHIDDYQIIEKYNLHEVGVLIAEKVSGYKMDINVIPFMNFAKLAEQYLFDANIKEKFCSYGLLVNTSEILDNELIHPKIKKDKVLKIEIVNKKEFEESSMYSKVTIYLPSSKEELEEKFKQINLDYNKLTIQDTHVISCEIVNFHDEILLDRFNKVMEYEIKKFFENSYYTPYQEIELLCKEVKKFDNTRMQKFLALAECKDKKINYIHDLVNYAKQTSNYNLLPNVNDLHDMGRYLVNETGHFDDVSVLEDYIDYYKLANDYTKRGCIYNGIFTEYGYLMEKEDLHINQKEEEEEQFE